MRIELILLSLILSIIVAFSVYFNRENKALKNAINSLQQTEFIIESNKKNLEIYNNLRITLSDCKLDENSFIINKINFEWKNLDFLDLIARLNEFYRDSNNFYFINHLKVNRVKGQNINIYHINGSLVVPCK